jgi:hypothetical protein
MDPRGSAFPQRYGLTSQREFKRCIKPYTDYYEAVSCPVTAVEAVRIGSRPLASVEETEVSHKLVPCC